MPDATKGRIFIPGAIQMSWSKPPAEASLTMVSAGDNVVYFAISEILMPSFFSVASMEARPGSASLKQPSTVFHLPSWMVTVRVTWFGLCSVAPGPPQYQGWHRMSVGYGFMFWTAAVTVLRLIFAGSLMVSMARTTMRAAM